MLEFKNISKSFSGVEVLHDVSFTIDFGKVTAIAGENGAGKSTLMKILSGALTDYEGDILLDNMKHSFKNTREAIHHGIAMIHQELNLVPDLSVAENIYLGIEPANVFGLIDYKKLYKNADELLKSYNFPYSSEAKINSLSVGWQQIVEIAKAIQYNAKILVMDEPTSALTQNEINILFEKIRYLKSIGTAIIYISHRMEELDEIADEIVILREGKFINKHKSNEITRDDLISEMIGKKLFETNRTFPKFETLEKLTKACNTLEVKNLSINVGEKQILKELHFKLQKGEVLGISGLMGSGKTELLLFIYGHLKCKFTGTLFYNGKNYIPVNTVNSIKNRIFYLSKNRKEESIFDIHNLIFNSSISSLNKNTVETLHAKSLQNQKTKVTNDIGWVDERREKEIVTEKFNKLRVKGNYNQAIKTLSGGNQQKVVLARGLLTQPALLLLDEPTRGIDIGAKEEIYRIINELTNEGMSVIFTSSEIPELLRCTDRILVLSHGRQAALLKTNETNGDEILKYAFS